MSCRKSCASTCAASIAEEIADVEIMLEQMKMLFCCTDDVRNERRRKVERLKERMDGDSDGK